CCLADCGFGRIGFVGDLPQDLLAHLARSELQREAVGKRTLERCVVQDTGMDEPAEQRLIPDSGPRLFADMRPDGVDCRDLWMPFCHDPDPPCFVMPPYQIGRVPETGSAARLLNSPRPLTPREDRIDDRRHGLEITCVG